MEIIKEWYYRFLFILLGLDLLMLCDILFRILKNEL